MHRAGARMFGALFELTIRIEKFAMDAAGDQRRFGAQAASDGCANERGEFFGARIAGGDESPRFAFQSHALRSGVSGRSRALCCAAPRR